MLLFLGLLFLVIGLGVLAELGLAYGAARRCGSDRLHGQLDSVSDRQFGEEALDVGLDGSLSDAEYFADLSVGSANCEVRQHAHLTLRNPKEHRVCLPDEIAHILTAAEPGATRISAENLDK